tara:strand:+ start:431 stop:706 length:276 start_codon:yes stop_codon:yes gene_type:complete
MDKKIKFLLISDIEWLGFKKGDIYYLFDRYLDFTQEHFSENQRKIRNYYYKYNLENVNTKELYILDEDQYETLQDHANIYVDITKEELKNI